MASHRDEHHGDERNWDPQPEGAAAPFPREDEWLQLPPPPFAAEFLERTLLALQMQRLEDDWASPIHASDEDAAADLDPDTDLDPDSLQIGPSREQLQAFAPDAPRPEFVAHTVARLQVDRRQRWQEMLARHIAPDPSPQFVQRTLDALAADRPAGSRDARTDAASRSTGSTRHPHAAADRRDAAHRSDRRWRRLRAALPWVAAAAALLWYFALRDVAATPFALRVAITVPAPYTHADTLSPLPTLLTRLAQHEDHGALPLGSADGYLLAQAAPRARGGR